MSGLICLLSSRSRRRITAATCNFRCRPCIPFSWPRISKFTDNVDVRIERNDILFTLRGDDAGTLSDVLAWFGGSGRLRGRKSEPWAALRRLHPASVADVDGLRRPAGQRAGPAAVCTFVGNRSARARRRARTASSPSGCSTRSTRPRSRPGTRTRTPTAAGLLCCLIRTVGRTAPSAPRGESVPWAVRDGWAPVVPSAHLAGGRRYADPAAHGRAGLRRDGRSWRRQPAQALVHHLRAVGRVLPDPAGQPGLARPAGQVRRQRPGQRARALPHRDPAAELPHPA